MTLAQRRGKQQLGNYLDRIEKRLIRQLLASRQRYQDEPGFVL